MSDKINETDGKEDENDAMMMADEETTEVEASEEELAQEALEATEEESETEEVEETETEAEESEEESEEEQTEEAEAEVDPKDAVIGDFRRKNRDLELENARIKGQLEVRESMQSTVKEAEVVKSPMELAEEAYIEEYGSLPPEGVPLTTKLWNEQKAFDANQTSTAASQATSGIDDATQVAMDVLQSGELSEEKVGKGKDFDTVVLRANDVLTDGDALDIKNFTAKNGKTKGLRKLYNQTVFRLKEAGEWDEAPAKKVVKKVATKTVKTKSKSVDEMLTEDDGVTADSGQSGKLSSFITGIC